MPRKRLRLLIVVPILTFAVTGYFLRGRPLRIEQVHSKGQTFSIVRIDLERDRLELFSRRADGSPYRDFAALDAELSRGGEHLRFATNSGMFGTNLKPLGLHVEGGKLLTPLNESEGDGNFFLKPNGVLVIDQGLARVHETSAYRSSVGDRVPTLAVQSGPLLVRDGSIHSKFDPHSMSRVIRSGVGVDRAGTVCFLISDDPVTFYEMAECFRDELKCPNALHLDGVISRLKVPGQRDEDGGPFAAVLAVRSR